LIHKIDSRNVFKPLGPAAGFVFQSKMGPPMPGARKLDTKKPKSVKPRGHGKRPASPAAKARDDTIVFDVEASTDSFVVVDDDFRKAPQPEVSAAKPVSAAAKTSGREPKKLDYYDDYYDYLEAEMRTDDEGSADKVSSHEVSVDKLSVDDRLKNLLKKELNEKFFHK
jgi:hypothetical protein